MRKRRALAFICLLNLAAYATEKPHLMPPASARSPWLSCRGQPPEDGAVGVLNMPGPERSDMPPYSLFVYWTAAKKRESVPSDTFLWSKTGYKEINSGEQCLQMQLLVFEMRGEWALLYGRDGWAWASLRQEVFDRRVCAEQERVSLLAAHLRDHIWRARAGSNETTEIPNRQGYTWSHDEEFIRLPPGPLRCQPRDDARVIDRLPGAWAWHTVAKPIARWPLDVSELSVEGEAQELSGEEGSDLAVPLRLLAMKGDWLRVQLPKAGTLAYIDYPGETEGCVGTVICWDERRTGWARWRSPGPLPGTFRHLIISVGDRKGME
jgi:hypothetical protein